MTDRPDATAGKPWMCRVCGTQFIAKLTRDAHEQRHLANKRYECHYCDMTFAENSNLQTHIRIHTGDRPYLCEACGLTFNHSSNLRRHQRRFHTGELPYTCCCGSGFFRQKELFRHNIKHSGEKPFKCEICGWQCRRRASLKKHKDTRHRPAKFETE